MKYHSNLILGAPLGKDKRKVWEDAILERFGGDVEKACEYASDIAKGQMTKSAGILSSTSILAGISYFTKAQAPLILAMIAILLTLASFYSKWSKDPEIVRNPRLELERTMHLCYNRSMFNNLAVFLAFASVVILAWKLL